MISIGILTHRAPITLKNTLLSYKYYKILDFTDDVFCIIQPSEKQDDEINICKDFNIRYVLEKENGWMAWGIKRVFEEAKYDVVLFTENDFRAMCDGSDILIHSIKWIQEEIVDMIRIRNLKNPGHPIVINSYKGRELENEQTKTQIHYSAHYLEEPEKVFPEYINKYSDDPRLLIMNSKNCGYTNNCFITSKRFYTKALLPYIQFGTHFEPQIDQHWSKADYKIGITDGFLTHIRMDGHVNCWCCHPNNGGISTRPQCLCCTEPYQPAEIFTEK